MDFGEFVTETKAGQGVVYTCLARDEHVWQKRTGQIFMPAVETTKETMAEPIRDAAKNLMQARYPEYDPRLPLSRQQADLRDNVDFQVDFKQMERCERLVSHLSNPICRCANVSHKPPRYRNLE